MKLSNFNFDLPDELLAEYPSEHRDEARLMVLNREKQTIEHKYFKDLIDYFAQDDVMILNNTKVFPARLFGNKEKTGARIEVFLLRELNSEQRRTRTSTIDQASSSCFEPCPRHALKQIRKPFEPHHDPKFKAKRQGDQQVVQSKKS